ncbi:MAG: helix-turn-helix domain-containing protein [Chlamydiia bacterium]|nr:helix-turn-helix domain-containing protein [Chlamydiia bacterium]
MKEADRLEVVRRVEYKEITLMKAAEEMALSYKQAKRIWKCYKQEGSIGLISKKRG